MPDVAVDASLAATLVFSERHTGHAAALFDFWARSGYHTLAPPLIVEELANSVYKRLARGEMSLDEALNTLAEMLALDIELEDVAPARALSLAHEHRLSAAYDGFYLALAEAQGCELWTADRRLFNSVRKRLPWVRWIGEGASGAV